MISEVVGHMGRIIVTRLEPKEDLLLAIRGVVKRSGIKAGVVLSITGAITHAVLQKFVTGQSKIGVVELEGPMEISGHGIVGWVAVPGHDKKPFGVGRYVDGEPYAHVHITVTTPSQTLCGHLMEGCLVRAHHSMSHFTIMIAEIDGAALNMTYDSEGLYHDLSGIPESQKQ